MNKDIVLMNIEKRGGITNPPPPIDRENSKVEDIDLLLFVKQEHSLVLTGPTVACLYNP